MKNVARDTYAYGVSVHKTARKERQAPSVNTRVTVKKNSAVPSIKVRTHSNNINPV